MAVHIRTPGATIAASTTTANVQLPAGTGKYIRAVNSSATALCYVNAGGSGVTATATNIQLAPYESRTFERDPNTDLYVAALLSTGTATIGFSIVGEDSGN